MQEAEALGRLCVFVGSSEPLLLVDAISNKISSTGHRFR